MVHKQLCLVNPNNTIFLQVSLWCWWFVSHLLLVLRSVCLLCLLSDSWVSGDELVTTNPESYNPWCNGSCVCEGVVFVCLCTYPVWTVLFCLLFVCELTGCGWGLWRWGQQCILLLVLLKNACVQSMKCDNLFIDSGLLCWNSPSFPVFYFTLPSQLPERFCVWIGVSFGLLNASVLTLCPSDDLSCVREILWFPFCLFLLASPFQWFWHCYGIHTPNCSWPSPTLSIRPTSTLLTNWVFGAQCRKKQFGVWV